MTSAVLRRWVPHIALWWLGLTPARATQIIWDCVIGRDHQISTGLALPESFVFEFGVFDASFTPTLANAADWPAHWHPVSRSAWDPKVRYVSGVYDFSQNQAPFLSGAQAWMWGMSGREWLLIKRSDWRWPTGSAVGGPPLTWTADGSVTAVVGSVVPSGSSFYYRSAAVEGATPPALPWAAWQQLHFTQAQLADPAVSGPDADADGDGVSTIMEYAAGTWPERATSRRLPDLTPLTIPSAAGTHLALRFQHDMRAQLSLSGERSSDLVTWETAPAATVIVSSSSGEIVIRDAESMGVAGRRFLRIRMAPQ